MKISWKDILAGKNPTIELGDEIESVGIVDNPFAQNFINKFLVRIRHFFRQPDVFIQCIADDLRPERKYVDDAGLDLKCRPDSIIIEPGGHALIPTGVRAVIPFGWEGQIRPRSGLAVRHGVVVGADTIDAGFRGEIQVHLINLGKDMVEFKYGHRIAQLVVSPCFIKKPVFIDRLPEDSERGSNGFGSTGVA